MKYRKLGSTGLEVSEIGFGAWGIGGQTGDGANSYGDTDDEQSRRALRCAYDAGITFYDTSNLYGYGHSEKLIGEELGDVRDKIVIASKVGFVKHGGPHNISPDYIKKSLEESLGRLGTDYIDLYQLHSPPIEMIKENPESVETLRALREGGLIKAFGLSVKNPEDSIPAINDFGFESIQVNFNMIDQRAVEKGVFDLAEEKNVGIIARTPLAFGFLTGKIEDLDFGDQDHRSSWPKEQLQRWADAPDLFSFINRGKKRTPTQLALAYCLAHPAVSTVIPGMLNCDQVKENAATPDIEPVGSEELEDIARVYGNHTFFDKSLKK